MKFSELYDQLIRLDEHNQIEAKTCGIEVGKSLLETICAYANEPGLNGGHILLGVARDDDPHATKYKIVGVQDPDKIQMDIVSQCSTLFNHAIRPIIQSEEFNGHNVITVFVPEAQPSEKPIFFKNVGLPKGAYRRVGSSDIRCTDDDLLIFYQNRSVETFDETVVTDADIDDFDSSAIEEYRREYAKSNPDAEVLQFSDEDLLRALGCTKKLDGILKPTVAGLILFGKTAALRRCFPMMRVDYIRIAGKEWIEDPEKRFESVDMLSSITRLIRRVQTMILEDIPKSFSLPADGVQRDDTPIIPTRAIREAVVNALMHRDYHVKGQVEIIRYSNRLEIRNPGYSLVAEERLGEPGSETRNPKIAAVLHDIGYAETKGSGIRAMQRMMKDANLPAPGFESDRQKNQFKVFFLFHHFLTQENLAWLTQFQHHNLSEDDLRALIFVREKGTITNLDYRNINNVDTLTASSHLRHLRDIYLLKMENRGSATYYTLDKKYLKMVPSNDTKTSNFSGKRVVTQTTLSKWLV